MVVLPQLGQGSGRFLEERHSQSERILGNWHITRPVEICPSFFLLLFFCSYHFAKKKQMKETASMSIWLTILATPLGVCSLIRRDSLSRGKLLSFFHSLFFFLISDNFHRTQLLQLLHAAGLWQEAPAARCATCTLICRQSAALHRAPLCACHSTA